ncbi:proteasome stabiliser-domain-containing protein [Lipomyces arxii]|uniref:proteasome stabiliser-domain-containing protein n=1 Tax=Lipomyces arxii TaxID=56418 RepID=UPI0034CF02BE
MASQELALVNKVEMRIALSNTDARLEALLKVYLAPLILKLGSPHEAVRNKVVSICNHINTRVKTTTIMLPVESLLAQFREPKIEIDANLLRSFCLMYIQIGVDRMPLEQKNTLIPEIIKGISTYQRPFQKGLFGILLKLLPGWKAPDRGSKDEEALQQKLGFDKPNVADARFLSDHFTSVILLNLASFSTNSSVQSQDGDGELDMAGIQRPAQSHSRSCPGVSVEEFEFLTSNSKDTISSAQLIPIKRAILAFSASALPESDRFWPALAGSQDNIMEVINTSEDILRKLNIDYENEEVVVRLYSLLLGTEGTPPIAQKFRTRILQLLSKSSWAANTSREMVKAIERGIASDSLKELQATMGFVNWVARTASPETLTSIAKDFMNVLLTRYSEGWGVEFSSTVQERAITGFWFESVGMLARRVPQVIQNDITLIKLLFESLKGQHADTRNSVHEALSTMIPVLHTINPDKLEELRTYLLEQMTLDPEISNSQYLAVRYSVAAFPFSDPVARYICLMGLDTANSTDTIAEARRGLHPYWFRKSHRPEFKTGPDDYSGLEYAFPEFKSMLDLLITKWASPDATNTLELRNISSTIVVEAFQFLRRILLMKALEAQPKLPIVDEAWIHKLDELVELDEVVRKNIVDLLGQWFQESDPALTQFLKILFDFFKIQLPGTQVAGAIWLEIVTLSPPNLIASLASKLDVLESLTSSINVVTRDTATHALGIISTSDSVDPDSIRKLVTESAESCTAVSNLPRMHGAIESLSYVLSRLSLRGKLPLVPSETITGFYKVLLGNLDRQAISSVRDASILAISQLGAYNVLSICSVDEVKDGLEKVLQVVRQTNNEKAMIAYGNLSLSSTKEVRLETAEAIYALHESKQVEFLFTSGEALSCVAAGWDSTVLKRSLDIQGFKFTTTDTLIIETVLERVLELCQTTKPSLKKASCVWLLSLVQFCGHLQPVIDHLKLVHYAFLGFLGDRDEMIQESASRGLGLVYERGDKNLKEDLVRSLVQSFTADTRDSSTAGRISGETQLFEPGVMNTGDGSVSTYKDIMSLAAEAGDPSLVYKFMSLASSSAIWSTRKGAAFGLGSILSSTNLSDILGSNQRLAKNLVPKLYRYRYDPSMAVQQSMKMIWDSLVQDSAGIVDAQFDDILEELLKRIGDREWRVRQASCAALQDLLGNAQWDKYADSLEQIWQMSFRALDDIKESVRAQAVSLCRSLTNALVRTVDAASGAANQRMSASLQQLLPFLLGNSGLQSQAQEVQSFSLDTLLKLVQKGGFGLRPFIPTLVEELLGLLSTLEPQAVNYIALNADKYGLTGNAIDATRLASMRSSPMMEAIDKCMDLLDDATMKDLYPKLRVSIRKSVGLPSKVACSRVLVTLVVRHIDLVRPYANRLLKVVVPQLQDRNDTVATSYAAASGYLCRVASNESVLELVSTAQKMYFDSEDDERLRVISGSIMVGISKHASDKFMSLAVSILPFVYVAKHDTLKPVKESFTSTWSENTGGVGAIKLYFGEILDLAVSHFESQQWRVRQTAALAVADASDAVGNQITQTERLFDVLIKASSGRSWEGKEKVVESLLNLAVKMKGYVDLHLDLRDRLYKLFLVEAKRNNEEYKVYARKFLERFCSEFHIAVTAL